ncbi:MAG: acyl--CoA ligase [Deltaproteobacteria bacterium]|nr:acyl--CoA ligase [Deltaproteobacteria bacterium]
MLATVLLSVVAAVVLAAVAVAVKLGFHQRLPLLFGRACEIDEAVDFAARRYGDRTLVDLEEPLAWRAPERIYKASDEREWSGNRIAATVSALAAVFRDLGAGVNDRVAIYKANHFDIFLFSASCTRLGAISVPINGGLDPALLAAYLDYVGASLLITDATSLAKLVAVGFAPKTVKKVVLVDGNEENGKSAGTTVAGITVESLSTLLEAPRPLPAPVPRGDDDILYITHTSGTTGFPKGVILLKRGLKISARAALLFNLVSRKDQVYAAIPYNHQVAHLYVNVALIFGGRLTVAANFQAKRALDTIAQRRVSVFFGFPITYTFLYHELHRNPDLSSIRVWATTADASHEVHQRAFVQHGSFLRRLGIPASGSIFVDGLGSSEVGIAGLLRLVGPWTKRFDRRVGRPVPFFGPSIKVVDESGRNVPVGIPGRLMIKGTCMFGGYWNAHDRLISASADGWWFTGDIVMRTKDGEYVHLDREVDVIRHGKGTSYTLPIEERLLRHPSVFDATVFQSPIPAHQGAPVAAIALRQGVGGISADQLLGELNALLGEKDRLAQVQLIPFENFPIGVTGKTLKRVFRAAA